ncbi:unnamed protein product [Moneuplotes crassus]|uniref:Uncharacterized protein n=1 Tax=Euplotes crassus TaxID=5936 RepID=A0AAD1U781_EUPCR|nr:unnamed protein product [Moneuplotes crassus]
MKRLIPAVKEGVMSVDMFTKPISLTFRGKDKFTSLLGGIVSTFLIMGVIAYSIQLSIQMFSRSATSKSKSSILKDIINIEDFYDIGEDSFDFAIALLYQESGVPMIDPTYFNISIAQRDYEYDFNSNSVIVTDTERKVSICGERYPKINEKIDSRRSSFMNISYCSEDKNFSIGGSIYVSKLKSMKIELKKCVNGTSVVCKSTAEINQKAENLSMFIITGPKYFDFDDYDNPIKGHLDDQYNFRVAAGIRKYVRMYLRKNKVSLLDSVYPFDIEQEKSFYSIGKHNLDFTNEHNTNDPYLIDFEIFQDNTIDLYERRVYSFLDLTGQLGGFFEILVIFGGLFVNYFSTKLYNYSLFNQLYCADNNYCSLHKSEIQIQPKPSKPVHKHFQREQNEVVKSQESSVSNGSSNQNDPLDKNDTKTKLIDLIRAKLLATRTFSFSFKDYLKSCLPFVKNRPKSRYQELNHRLNRECDLPEVIGALRQLKTLVKMLANDHQRLLMSFDSRGRLGQSQAKQSSTSDTLCNHQFWLEADFPSKHKPNIESYQSRVDVLVEKLKEVTPDELKRDSHAILGISYRESRMESRVESQVEFAEEPHSKCSNPAIDSNNTKDKSLSKIGLMEEEKENEDWKEYPVKDFKDI